MAKLTQRAVSAFFSPRRKRTIRVNRKLEEAEPVFSEPSSSDDDPAHFALEPKSQLLDLVDSPPRYITSSSSSDSGEPSASRPARRLVRRSEAGPSQAPASTRKPSRTTAPNSKVAAAAPVKTAARAQWEGKKSKAVGKEKDISRPLTRAGKWTDDEDEDAADREAAAAVVDDDWLVSDASPPLKQSKGKERAVADAQSAPASSIKAPAPTRSSTVARLPKSPVSLPKLKLKAEAGSDDSDGGLKPAARPAASLPRAQATTSTVEDLLDAAVGSQISKETKPRPVAVKPETGDDALDDSDGSVLIMDTPPPESPPPRSPTKKAVPPPSAQKPRPTSGKSVVVKKVAQPAPRAFSLSASPSSSPGPAPAPSVGASQRAQRLQERTKQQERPSARAGPSRRQPPGSESTEIDHVVRPSASRKRARRASTPSSAESTGSDAARTSQARASQLASQKRKSLGKRKATPVSSDSDEDDNDDQVTDESSSDEDRRKKARAKKKKAQAAVAAKRRKRPLDSTDEEGTDEEEERRRRKRKKQKQRKQRRALVDSNDEEGTDSEPDDLEDDRGRLLTLQSRMRSGTERAGTKELARRAMLEKLKKRKQQRGSGITSLLTEDEDEESDEEEAYTEIWGRDARGRYATEDDSEFEKEFIEDDDKEIDQLDLPSAFRSDASQPMELNFNVVVQWHVHAIIKGRQWAKKAARDPYFQSPLTRLRDHVLSTRNSGVTSQVWPSHFKKALDRFPVFEGFTIKGNSPPCDACRITSRPATRKIELSGKRFNPVTFERIAYDSEESEDEGLKGLDSEFNCGRYCFQRARVYHSMTHWEDDIHEWLCDTIDLLPDDEDERPGTATIRVDGGSHKISSLPNKNDPDKVVEWLTKKVRWVTSQWSLLNDLIESGRNLDAEFRRWEA